MVECRRYLNQRLEEAFFWLFKCQPDTFPVFMSQKELASPVAGEAIFKRAGIPIKGHAFSLSDSVAYSRKTTAGPAPSLWFAGLEAA